MYGNRRAEKAERRPRHNDRRSLLVPSAFHLSTVLPPERRRPLFFSVASIFLKFSFFFFVFFFVSFSRLLISDSVFSLSIDFVSLGVHFIAKRGVGGGQPRRGRERAAVFLAAVESEFSASPALNPICHSDFVHFPAATRRPSIPLGDECFHVYRRHNDPPIPATRYVRDIDVFFQTFSSTALNCMYSMK